MKKALLTLFLILTIQKANAEIAVIPSSGAIGDAFKTGDFDWSIIVAFILHIIQLLISLAGGVAVILLMIGGFKFVFGAMSDSKEAGMATVKNTLLGFTVILLSWIIVDLLITFLTK